ncbi:MAG: helix-turn-helix domain-containing protein [Gloeotrichia echinulata DVL01]|nr:helix-turn-helix domain-containing protein [Gloeotrichia echinulata DEX184]
MKTTYQYQFYPDTNQKIELNEWLRISRYSTFLNHEVQ